MSTWFLNTSKDGDPSTYLGSLFQCLMTLYVKIFFLISKLNLTWLNVRISSFPLLFLVTWVKTSTLTSLEPPFQPLLFQTKQSHFSHPLFMRLVLHTLHQLCWLSVVDIAPSIWEGQIPQAALTVRPTGPRCSDPHMRFQLECLLQAVPQMLSVFFTAQLVLQARASQQFLICFDNAKAKTPHILSSGWNKVELLYHRDINVCIVL